MTTFSSLRCGWFPSAACGILLLGALGCGTRMLRPNKDVYVQPSSLRNGTEIFVGAAMRDITPPAGASLAGHGPGGRVAMGHWTRLYCRAFYIEPTRTHVEAKQSPVALVSCELPYMSTLLVRRTLEVLDERTKSGDVTGSLKDLDATRLMIAAIHTHAGPAHFFDVPTLSGFASSQFPGHDPKMVTFLAERIADALIEAHARQQPAELRWLRSNVFSFSRNSALRQFLLNVPRPEIPKCEDPQRRGGRGTPCSQLGPGDLNIDPRLRLLEFRNLSTKALIGGVGFYALHPTFIGNRNRHYGSDIFGVVTRNMEQELRREAARECRSRPIGPGCAQPRPPIFALFNTNEADAQPRRIEGTEAEVVRNGNLLTEAVWRTHCSGPLADRSQLCQEADDPREAASTTAGTDPEPHAFDPTTPELTLSPEPASDATSSFNPGSGATQNLVAELAGSVVQTGVIVLPPEAPVDESWTARPVLSSRYVDVNLPKRSVVSPSTHFTATLQGTGQLGIAATKGSLASPTAMLFLTPQTIETFNYNAGRRRKLKGPKRGMPFATGVAKTVPLSVLQLHHTILSFVPAEITLAVGQMINTAVLTSAQHAPVNEYPVKDAVVVGLANGYMNYVTTPQEYMLQAYHGASTVYGIQSAHFLTYTLECLARHLTLDHERCEVPGAVGAATRFKYRSGPKRERLWSERRDKRTKIVHELVATRACKLENTEPPMFCFRWEDEGPYAVSQRPWLVRVQTKARGAETRYAPLVVNTIPFQSRGGERVPDELATSLVDDHGMYFLTQVLFRKHRAWHWSTLFSPGPDVWEQIKDVDFRIAVNRGEDVVAIHSQNLREVSPCTAQMINEYCTTDP